MNKAQNLMMNFWTPTFAGWGDGFNDWDMPWYVMYDWVEVYKYNSTTGGFDFYWRDDFTLLNTSRWLVSNNWTFGDNSSLFISSHVYTLDGLLWLKMSKTTAATNDEPTDDQLSPIQ